MADSTEARREARRRKILQNSENRMNRLLGKASTDNNETVPSSDSTSRETAAASRHPSFTTEDGSITEAAGSSAAAEGVSPFGESSLRQRTLRTGSVAAEPSTQQTTVSSNRAAEGFPSSEGEVSSSTGSIPSSTESVFSSYGASAPGRDTGHVPGQSATRGERSEIGQSATRGNRSEVDGERAGVSGHSGLAADPARLMNLLRCGGCVLAAVITRWALACGLALIFCEFVLVPFVLLEGFLFYFHAIHMKDVQVVPKTTLITYALVLSGMKQELITRYNIIMGYIRIISEDFAVFLFTFLVCHAIMG